MHQKDTMILKMNHFRARLDINDQRMRARLLFERTTSFPDSLRNLTRSSGSQYSQFKVHGKPI